MILHRLSFWLKTTAAFALCLWIGFEISLTMASSAAVTIAILADPDSGAVFSKSKWRFIGTILGGVVFLLLALPFVQTPWLFLLGLAVWSGLCYYVSTYFRYFQAYGALLAGYTATILLSDAGTGENVVLTTIERVSEIILAVACVAFVFGVTHLRRGIARLEPEMHRQARRVFDIVAELAHRPSALTQARLLRLWVKQTDDLQRQLLMLGEEEAIYAKQAKSIRLALMDLFAPLAQFSENFLALASVADNPACQKARDEVLRCLDALLPNTGVSAVSLAIENVLPELRKPLELAAAQINNPEQRSKVSAIYVSLQSLLHSLLIYRRARNDPASYPIRSYGKLLEKKVVFADAVGVTLGYLLFSLFWVSAEWTYGPISLLMFISITMLQLPTDRPLTNIISMLKGLGWAFVVCAPLKFFAFPLADGFIGMIFWLSVALFPGCWFRSSPKTAVMGSGYLLCAIILLGITNNMSYNIGEFMNMMAALTISLIGAIALTAVIHPWRAETKLNLLARNALDDLDASLWAVWQGDRVALTFWEDRQFARIRQLDHIVMMRRPELLDGAANLLLQMTVVMRRFANEMDLAKLQGHLSDTTEIDRLLSSYAKSKPSNNIDLVASRANAIAEIFERRNDSSREQAWKLISHDLSGLRNYALA